LLTVCNNLTPAGYVYRLALIDSPAKILANLYIPFTVNLQEKIQQHATLMQEQLHRI